MEAKERAGLAAKIVKIAAECSHIERDGKADFGGYRYISSAAVLDRFGPACTKHGVATRTKFETVTPWDATITTKKGETERFVRVKCVVELVDDETGEVWSTEGYGDGADPRDKAIYKAQTGARRDAIKNLCNTSTKEDREAPSDPEHDEPTREPAPRRDAPPPVTATLDLVIDSGSLKGKKVRDLTPEQVTGCRAAIDGMLATAAPARKPYLTALLASLLLAQGHGERGAAA